MDNKSVPPIEVTCPCCQARLSIDPGLAVVLAHVPPPRIVRDVEIENAARILQDQARSREDKFRESCEAERKKEDVLNRKFEEALKKAKDQPSERPLRDFDLE